MRIVPIPIPTAREIAPAPTTDSTAARLGRTRPGRMLEPTMYHDLPSTALTCG